VHCANLCTLHQDVRSQLHIHKSSSFVQSPPFTYVRNPSHTLTCVNVWAPEQGGIILAQNEQSLQLYGKLEGMDVPRVQNGHVQELQDGAEGSAELKLQTEGSGLLTLLFALESPEALQEMLHVSA